MKPRRRKFEHTPNMARYLFAVQNTITGEPVYVVAGETGFRRLRAQGIHELANWQRLRDAQPDAVTEAALSASMFGWNTPAGARALTWAQEPVPVCARAASRPC